MRVLRRVFVVTIGGAVALASSALAVGPAGATRVTKAVGQERLLNVDYQDGLVTPKDAKAFLGVAAVTPDVGVLGAGEWQSRFCNQLPPQVSFSVAGRSVQYDPSRNASMVNSVVAFDTPKHAKQFVKFVQQAARKCSQPYVLGTTTFTPGPAPKVPEVGDERATLGGTFRFSNGQTASSAVVVLQQDQVVDYAQMISTAPITKQIVGSVAKGMGKRLGSTVAAAKAAEARPKKKSRISSCEEVLTKANLERAFAVSLQEPDDCSYALAQGFGGVDVAFADREAADRSYPAIAKGEPIAVKGAADALYSTSTNQFGQVSEKVYVRLKNGDMLTIGLRGDDAPKNQEVQLTQAAKAAVKNA
jgi:hypothetical protein